MSALLSVALLVAVLFIWLSTVRCRAFPFLSLRVALKNRRDSKFIPGFFEVAILCMGTGGSSKGESSSVLDEVPTLLRFLFNAALGVPADGSDNRLVSRAGSVFSSSAPNCTLKSCIFPNGSKLCSSGIGAEPRNVDTSNLCGMAAVSTAAGPALMVECAGPLSDKCFSVSIACLPFIDSTSGPCGECISPLSSSFSESLLRVRELHVLHDRCERSPW